MDLRGYVEDPAPVYREAQVFALPSAAEGLPLALLQAMSAALPAVATSVGGIPDVLRPGIDGRLVAADDLDGFTAALRELLDDQALRRTMGKQARERILADYTLDRCVDRLLDVYTG